MQFFAFFAADLKVNLLGGGLILLGLSLLFATLAFWNSAIEDPVVLAPLEVMADRKFARADGDMRVQILNDARPVGAQHIEVQDNPTMLMREPLREPERQVRDPFPHDDDAVDVVKSTIDPLLGQRNK